MAKNAPMPAAKIKYNEKGEIAWDSMWGSFCDLAIEGGPPHRGKDSSITEKDINKHSDTNEEVVSELKRGLSLLTENEIVLGEKGWVKVLLNNKNMAKWFATIINSENVIAKVEENYLLLPCSDNFSITNEVKSVLTVFGKAKHYWNEHRTAIEKIIISFFGYDLRIGKSVI